VTAETIPSMDNTTKEANSLNCLKLRSTSLANKSRNYGRMRSNSKNKIFESTPKFKKWKNTASGRSKRKLFYKRN